MSLLIPADLTIPEFLRRKDDMPKIGPKEAAHREVREGKMKKAKTDAATLRTMVKALDAPKTGRDFLIANRLPVVEGDPINDMPVAAAPAKPPQGATKETTVKTAKQTAKKTGAKAPAKKTAAKAAPKAPAARTKKATPKKAAKENARTPVSARPDGLREGSKQAVMLDLALATGGATEKTICAKLGWKKCRVTLKRVCEKVGAKLDLTKNADGETVFQASLQKAKS